MRFIIAFLACIMGVPALAADTGGMLGVWGGPGAAAGAMITPVMSNMGAVASPPSTSALNYGKLAGGSTGSIWGATASTQEDPIAVAGTFGNLSVYLPTQPGAAASTKSYDVGMVKNGTKQTLVCNVLENSNTCTDNTHTFTVAAGDLVSWFTCPSNGSGCTAGAAPTAQAATPQISSTFTSTANQESFLVSNNSAPSTSATNYGSFGGNLTVNATENIVSNVMPAAGVIDQLYVQPSNTPSPGTIAATIVLNGTPTSLTCTVSANAQCSDTNTGHAFTVARGDTVSIQFTPSSSPTSRVYAVGVRWVPSVLNTAVMLNSWNTVPSNSATRFSTVNGTGGSDSSETSIELNGVPVVSGNMTMGGLTVLQSTAPGGVTTRTVTLRAGAAGGASQSSQSPSCTVTSAATTCQDNSTYSASTGQAVNIQTTVSGTNAAVSYMKSGMTVTIP